MNLKWYFTRKKPAVLRQEKELKRRFEQKIERKDELMQNTTIIMQSIKSKPEREGESEEKLSFIRWGLNIGKMVSNNSVGCACFSICGLLAPGHRTYYYQIIGMKNMCILRHRESHAVRMRVILAVEKFWIANCDNFENEWKKRLLCFGKCVSYMRYRKHLIYKTMWFLSLRSPPLSSLDFWLSVLESESQMELTEQLKNNNLSI